MIPDVPEKIGIDLKEFLTAVKTVLDNPEVLNLESYTVQELSSLLARNYENKVVVCSNGNAGAECLAYCNGRAWHVISLGDRISIS
jgi:hypothetical protein